MLLFLLLQIVFAVALGKGVLPGPVEMCRGDDVRGVLSPEQFLPKQEKVKFQFYYETGCPYSIKTYIKELQDAVKVLAPYLDISTYPYGNAHMKLNGSQLAITCQHEEEECYGNRLHACAIDALIVAAKYVPFNACMMAYDIGATSNDAAADECGRKLNVDARSIKECAKGIRGFELLLHYGLESDKADYLGVPWWYINGVSKTGGEVRTLKQLLCAAFRNPPPVCKS